MNIGAKLVILAGLAALVGCDSGDPTPFPQPTDTGADAAADVAAGDAADGGGADTVTEDMGAPEPLTCEGLSALFSGELAARASAWDACAKDSDCELIEPQLQCPAVGTKVVDCPSAVAELLEFAVQKVAIEDKLCPDAPAGCTGTPGCPEVEAGCNAGHCIARLVQP